MTLTLCCISSVFNSTVMKRDAQLRKQVTISLSATQEEARTAFS